MVADDLKCPWVLDLDVSELVLLSNERWRYDVSYFHRVMHFSGDHELIQLPLSLALTPRLLNRSLMMQTCMRVTNF